MTKTSAKFQCKASFHPDDIVELNELHHFTNPNKEPRPVHWDSIDVDLESMESYFQSTSNLFVANKFPTSGQLESILEESDPDADPETYSHLLQLARHDVGDEGERIDHGTYIPPCNEPKQWGLTIWAEPEYCSGSIAGNFELNSSMRFFHDSPPHNLSFLDCDRMDSARGGPIKMSAVPTEQLCASMIDCALPSIVYDPTISATFVPRSGARHSSNKHRRARCVML